MSGCGYIKVSYKYSLRSCKMRCNNMTNTVMLKAKMILNHDTVLELANFLGLNRQNLSAKINGKREFKQSEIGKIAFRYDLTYDEMKEIFFVCENLNVEAV